MSALAVSYQKTMWPDSSPLFDKCESIALPIYEKVKAYVEKNGMTTNRKEILFAPNCNPFSTESVATSGIDLFGIDRHVVGIAPLLLIDLKTLPEKFKVESVKDDRLEDKSFIDDCISCLNQEYFKIEGLSPDDLTEEDRNQVKHFLIMASNPEQFENMVEFAVTHELAHHVLEHETDLGQTHAILENSFTKRLPWLIGGLLGPLAAGLHTLKGTKSKTLFGTFMVCFGAGLYLYDLSNQLKAQRGNEKEADLMAAKIIGKIDGGMYWLKSLINMRNHAASFEQKSEAERKQALNQLANMYWLNDHPTFEERIAYIEAFAKNDLSKQLQYWRPVVSFRWTTTVESTL